MLLHEDDENRIKCRKLFWYASNYMIKFSGWWIYAYHSSSNIALGE